MCVIVAREIHKHIRDEMSKPPIIGFFGSSLSFSPLWQRRTTEVEKVREAAAATSLKAFFSLVVGLLLFR